MRFLIFGAGAIGGVLGSQLHLAGHEVVMVARGRHLEAIKSSGLVFESPGGSHTLRIEAQEDPSGLDWTDNTVVLLCVKSQDTDGALSALLDRAPPWTPLVCAQNGVENERRASRFFRTYGMCVMCPATHLRPGVVQAHSEPVVGMMDVGRYPTGTDDTAEEITNALRDAAFDSYVVGDIMRWKYRKLLVNLANAVEALCGRDGRGSELAKGAYLEGKAVLDVAGIPFASSTEDTDRRGNRISVARSGAPARDYLGGSSWQSLARGTGTVETDYLNGEIVLLGHLCGAATPLNAFLQRRMHDRARHRTPPGGEDPDVLLAEALSTFEVETPQTA